MNIPDEKDQMPEERKLIANIFCLVLLAFFLWGYGTTFAAQFGLFRWTTIVFATDQGEESGGTAWAVITVQLCKMRGMIGACLPRAV